MEIRDNVVVLPKLREVNPRRASAVIGEKAKVSVPMPAPAAACKIPNAEGVFKQRPIQEIYELMSESGKLASSISLD